MRVRPWMRPFLVTPFPHFFTLESCGIFVALQKVGEALYCSLWNLPVVKKLKKRKRRIKQIKGKEKEKEKGVNKIMIFHF